MKRRDSELEPELEALLTPRRIERQVPADLRGRVLARARATMAGDVIPPAQPLARPAPGPRRWRLLPIALAASFAIAGAAVGAMAALHRRGAQAPEVLPDRAPPPSVPVTPVGNRANDAPPPVDARETIKPSHPAHPGPKGDAFTAGLELLQRAHAAYTRREFSAALALVAEHARRFPRGHLAEQREALRVRSLLGAGRPDEARRAATAFAARFPRSVLLPRVAEGSESSER